MVSVACATPHLFLERPSSCAPEPAGTETALGEPTSVADALFLLRLQQGPVRLDALQLGETHG